MLVLPGFCQTPGLWNNSTVDALAAFKAESNHLILLDPNWDDDPRALEFLYKVLPYVDLFFPNKEEVCKVAGSPSFREATLDLAEAFSMTVITTLGINGCFVVDRVEGQKHYPAVGRSSKNTNGAGDIFHAGFLYYFSRTGDKHWSAQQANRLAGIAVQFATFADKLEAVKHAFKQDWQRESCEITHEAKVCSAR